MPVGEILKGPLLAVDGVEISSIEAGIRYPDRKDLVVLKLDEGSRVAGVFTTNRFCAAPVHVAKANLAQSSASRALIINTGNANAGTGAQGMQDAQQTCEALAEALGVAAHEVLPFSTGVIGETLPMDALLSGILAIPASFGTSDWESAARGIMTTDTAPKACSAKFELAGEEIVITGISKGSGMIKPNMATMLGFVATNAKLDEAALAALCTQGAESSFNRITVDGDTSTNDACMLMATCKTEHVIRLGTPEFEAFQAELNKLMLFLAHAIVRDGEGATKFVAVKVQGGSSTEEALKVAYTVAESPLVKTALFASDPNWGRILAAVGRAGIDDLNTEALEIFLDEVQIVANGGVAADYTEEAGQAVMNREEIEIRIVLNRGETQETVWTTDLSHQYVSINADYRS